MVMSKETVQVSNIHTLLILYLSKVIVLYENKIKMQDFIWIKYFCCRFSGKNKYNIVKFTLLLLIPFQMSSLQKTTKHICDIITQIDNPTDAFNFLRDLLTETELEEFAQRREIAKMLSENVPYKTIEKKTGASSTTIARVKKYLDGKWGGYRKRLGKD